MTSSATSGNDRTSLTDDSNVHCEAALHHEVGGGLGAGGDLVAAPAARPGEYDPAHHGAAGGALLRAPHGGPADGVEREAAGQVRRHVVDALLKQL
eukprot:scaffold9982_cov20-Prasinocladus_malaysianus.AAC.1